MKRAVYLRRYRKAKKLTQKQVAARMGLRDSSLISRWENGFSLPDLENALKLSAIYGVTVNALFQRPVEELAGNNERVTIEIHEDTETKVSQVEKNAVNGRPSTRDDGQTIG
jgi:transcriptional regulator with XRE-family HTH domain